jgi:hypothetical protein
MACARLFGEARTHRFENQADRVVFGGTQDHLDVATQMPSSVYPEVTFPRIAVVAKVSAMPVT